ncbi:MAG: hypothetical protein JST59_02860 [Actinobacteria bacterium]|nr:hypothetical protein [Actinomycetota bacterium]
MQASVAKSMFDADEFGRTLSNNEQISLMNFLFNKFELMKKWPHDKSPLWKH